MQRTMPNPIKVALVAFLAIALLLAISSSTASGSEQASQDATPRAEISRSSATGVASFVRFPGGLQAPAAAMAVAAEGGAAGNFFANYGQVFGVSDASSELQYIGTYIDQFGNRQVSFQQVYQQVPVFAGILKVHLNDANAVTAANGTFIPKIAIDANPKFSESEAGAIATFAVAGQGISLDGYDLSVANTTLYVYREGLLEGVPGENLLVYEVEVVNSDVSVREFVYVDAHTGAVVNQISGIHQDLHREISEVDLANVVWAEGDPDPIPPGWAGGTAQQVIDWQNEADGAAETYYLFASMGGWDSYDNAGATMRTINNAPFVGCPNATWNGTSTNYCTDVTGDDTVAHEWGHAYTDNTNNLIYQWQSGALNESYSDIWGDVVDLLNGRGLDTPDVVRPSGYCSSNAQGANFPGNPTVDTVRWLSGEDDPAFFGIPSGSGNAIRDMWDPTCFGDPGKVSDTEYWCSTADGGGVHTNSGVPNHAFALLVDGGTYNGYAVDAIGLTKAAHIHWAAQNMLTPASNFVDHANALQASCLALTGVDLPALSTSIPNSSPSGEVITAADCQEVADAIAAVEFNTPPTQCEFGPLLDPNAPALCEGLGDVQPIFSENWEGATLPSGWEVGTHSVANPPTFDTPDWSVVGNLPSGANGTYAAFVPDLIIGDCALDDESGALFLDSPEIMVPSGVFPRVAFDHWVATEVGWDGGNLKVSVNSGPWTLVPPDQYVFNAYNSVLNGPPGNTNPLASQPAFTGTDGGSVGGSWGQSQVNLLGLAAAGDTVRFRFDFGIDGCNGAVGWYVDDFEVFSCSDDPGPICGNAILEPTETCDDGNTANGDGCSNVCQVEEGWFCEDPTPPNPDGTNVVGDWSFEAGYPNPEWTPFSTFGGLPGFPLCGPGNGCPAAGLATTGVWNVWIGGLSAGVTSSVSQDVIIPSTATELTVQVLRGICDDASDTLHVSLDGNDIGTLACDGEDGDFVEHTFSAAGYNDDASHTLSIGGTVGGTNGTHTNFFVDDVNINDNVPSSGSPSVCKPFVDDLACGPGIVGFNEGIPGSWTVVDNAGTGMVWSNIVGAGEADNYTGGNGDAATASSDAFGPADFDTELRSNLFDLPHVQSASVSYLANYQNFAAFDFLDLDISADGGATWTNLLSWNEDHGGFRSPPGEAVDIDLGAYQGMSDLQLRWRYYDPTSFDWDWYAQVDNVGISCEGYPVTIDIMPGSNTNPINMKKNGEIPVAILTTDDFDATTVDPATAQFGPAGAVESHGQGHIEDVDLDGDLDLVLHFYREDTGIQCGSTSASLTALTFGGQLITGTDSIVTRGCK